MFCSRGCMERADVYLKTEHIVEIRYHEQRMFCESLAICGGSYDKLKQLMIDPELSNKTIFDFDFSNPDDPLYKFHQLVAFNGLQQDRETNEKEKIESHPMLNLMKSSKERKICQEALMRVSRLKTANSFCMEFLLPIIKDDSKPEADPTKLDFGLGIFLFASLFNHSCNPNIERVSVENKMVIMVRLPVRKDQQLFIDYGQVFVGVCAIIFNTFPSSNRSNFQFYPLQERQRFLKKDFGFVCSCEACIYDYPRFKEAVVGAQMSRTISVAECKKNYKLNCKEITKRLKRENPPNDETSRLMDLNLFLMSVIAKNEPFIF
jgi:SET domain